MTGLAGNCQYCGKRLSPGWRARWADWSGPARLRPLWVSGDTRHCPKCQRETNWLDIVSSALTKTHQKKLLVEVILGERKYVNVEVPNAIADLSCYNCKNPILDLRSFKCHNWAYAREALLDLIKEVSI
jgi:hypothetical protein